jgi:hypothetical protein
MSTGINAQAPSVQQSAASPTYDSLRTLIYHDATISIDGTDRSVDVQDLEIEVANNVTLEARDKREPTKAFVGAREVTATATLDFENDTLFRLFLGGSSADSPQETLANVGLNAKWVSPETIEDTSENYSLEFDLPNCRINTHDANLSEREMIAENVEFRAIFDASAGYDAEATLKNGKTNAY